MKPNKSRLVTWVPHPGPQSMVGRCPADIILYGGAAGGGKTDVMLIEAAKGVKYDGYQAIIFRRTYKELEKHIIGRSQALYGGFGRYNEKEYKWTFPTPDGGRAYIYLAYLEHDKDVYNYHGGQFQFIGFDESTMFSAFQVRFMLLRLRNPAGIPIDKKMLLCSNPIGPGFGWHRQMFIENAKRGKLEPLVVYNNAEWPDLGEPVLKTTCFIPAMVWDNPTLLKNDPDYVNSIRSQGGSMSRALLGGSWDETLFQAIQFDRTIHTIDPIEIPKEAPRWIGLDWGKSDKAAAVWQTSFGGRVYWYRDHARPGEMIKPFAEEIVARSVGEKIDFVVLSHEAFSQHGEGHTQADQFVEVFSKAGITVMKSDKDPEGRLMLLREFLRWTKDPISDATKGLDDYEYWQSRVVREGENAWKEYARLRLIKEETAELPKLQIFRQAPETPNFGCPYIILTLPLLTTDIEKPKQLADGQDDHGFDAGTYGLKGYVMHDETSVLDAYMKQLGGRIPDSGFAAELAMKAARESVEGDGSEDEPFQMGVEKFDDEGFRGGGFGML